MSEVTIFFIEALTKNVKTGMLTSLNQVHHKKNKKKTSVISNLN